MDYGCIVLLKIRINIIFLLDSTTRSPQRDRKDRNHKGKGRKKDKKKKGNGMFNYKILSSLCTQFIVLNVQCFIF